MEGTGKKGSPVIAVLIVVCEVGFWILLAGGLALRYLAKMPRTGVAVLLLEPLLELVLLVVTAVDLKNGAEPDWKHGLAAAYIGFSVALGHRTIKWVDVRFAHRFAGGPPPVPAPKYGRARTVFEWQSAARWILAALIAMGLLEAAIRYVGDPAQTTSLRGWQTKMLFVIGINLVIATSYTIWPKQAPAADLPQGGTDDRDHTGAGRKSGW
ncbi:membrane protein [Streptomyces rimosus subsp. pseudoverticillatus]|nr:membrane protein [Streptomyces rimosus subsp. pseudoverticillatus]